MSKYFRLVKRVGRNSRGFTTTYRFLVDASKVIWGVFLTERYARTVEKLLIAKYEPVLKERGTFTE